MSVKTQPALILPLLTKSFSRTEILVRKVGTNRDSGSENSWPEPAKAFLGPEADFNLGPPDYTNI